MLNVVRIIPVTIVAALILLGVKVGDVWSGLEQAVLSEPVPTPVESQLAEGRAASAGGGAPAAGPGGAATVAGGATDQAARRFALSAQANAEEQAEAPAGPQPRKAVIESANAQTAQAQTAQAQTGDGQGDNAGADGPEVPAAPKAQGGAVSGTLADGAGGSGDAGMVSGSPAEFSQAEIELLQNLSRRRDELDGRERQIEMRENLLAATEKRIDERIAELRRIESQIDSLLIKYDEQRKRQIDSLVKIYQNMKPKDAARIFERLDMNVLLEVAENMKSRSLAPILAEMDANRAQKVTVELATRRQLPGTN